MPFTSAHHAESVSTSRPPATPTNRIKFLCSHGGNILPCPADAHLKYVGGETRVISVRRDITFHELMKKLTSMYNGEMILKYQLMPDDLDVLVTVKSDEDIRHMFEECDRLEHLVAPRLRAFLFPVVMVNHSGPSKTATDSINPGFNSYHGKGSLLTRNHSSPNLCSVGCSSVTNHMNHHQPPPQHHHLSPKPPLDRHPHKSPGPEHIGRVRPAGVGEYYRQQMDQTVAHGHRTDKGGHVYYQSGSGCDDYCGHCRYD
ncbi:hypothetical protein QVD17_06206 [Tagetes erecta]|uniref:PB1 domain-containing protein n=1 Tax=Tagetes erecta TaxID=13708 RepID=A0AAD8LK67_TARER|nr:hypothetical protein QVD17_06206 [Tagetes erecta]